MYDNLTAPISINQVKYGAMFAIAIFSCSEFKTNTKFIKGENIMSVTSNDDVISVLNNLIETCRDGQNGFQAAAEGITQTEVKKLFAQYAQQRAQFVGERRWPAGGRARRPRLGPAAAGCPNSC